MGNKQKHRTKIQIDGDLDYKRFVGELTNKNIKYRLKPKSNQVIIFFPKDTNKQKYQLALLDTLEKMQAEYVFKY